VVNAAASGHLALGADSALANFAAATAGQSCSDRGRALAAAKSMQELSDETAAAGETEGAGTDDAQNSHFICFVCVGGLLYELDGRMKADDGEAFPVAHGPTTPDTFVADAAKVHSSPFIFIGFKRKSQHIKYKEERSLDVRCFVAVLGRQPPPC
jgi:hypothetical protein